MMTWHTLVLFLIVAALWTERRRVSVPTCPTTTPTGFKSGMTDVNGPLSDGQALAAVSPNSCFGFSIHLFHCSSSASEHALRMTSNNCWSDSKTIFHENNAAWHCKPVGCQLRKVKGHANIITFAITGRLNLQI